MPRLPKCAWLLIASLFLISSHAVGAAATVVFLLAAVAWVFATPAALVAVAALAAWHLTSCHTPRAGRRRTPARAHP